MSVSVLGAVVAVIVGGQLLARPFLRFVAGTRLRETFTAAALLIDSPGFNLRMASALKKLGVPVELVRYPRSSHGLSRTGEPWLLVDRLERLRSWFVAMPNSQLFRWPLVRSYLPAR